MNPFILQFRELPQNGSIDFSIIEYDELKNLNVYKHTKTPAVEFLNAETLTFTKTQGEGSDSDKNFLHLLSETQTSTRIISESSDSDSDVHMLLKLLDTQTLTESQENTDQDR